MIDVCTTWPWGKKEKCARDVNALHTSTNATYLKAEHCQKGNISKKKHKMEMEREEKTETKTNAEQH